MPITINRPARTGKPTGLLGYDYFQDGYITNDIERAMATLKDSMGITNWTVLSNPGVMEIRLAWINGKQIELIETEGEFNPLYDHWIDKGGEFAIRHHHFGYYLYDDAEWAQLNRQIDALGRKRLMEAEIDMLKVIYVDAPEVGHYLEFIYPNEKGKAFFESVASN